MASSLLTASVVFSTKNRKDDLRRALKSTLAQTQLLEVLVLDDGSTDGTAEMIAREFPQVILHSFNPSEGYIVQRNRAAALAKGDIIFSLDDDGEYSTPQVIEQTLREFDRPRVGAVAIPYMDMNRRELIRGPAPDATEVYVTDSFVGTAYAIRRDLFLKLNGFREILFHQEEERDLALRMLDHGYVTRIGRTDIIHHYESPIRNFSRMTVYTARNRILYVWHNIPFPYLTVHLAVTTINLIRWGFRIRKAKWALKGLAMGYAALAKELLRRDPVTLNTFKLSRDMLRDATPPVILLSAIEHRLPSPAT